MIYRVFLLLACLFCPLFAEEFESFVKYKVGYGIFTLGEAEAYLKIYDNGSYKTEVSAKAKGLASTLSGSRVEKYASSGLVVENMLIPYHFEKISSHGSTKRHIEYFWDYENAQILMERERCKDGGCEYSSEILSDDKYASNDILTLYHNIMFDLNKTGAKEINASAIGSKKPVVIMIPEGKWLKTAKKTFDDKEGIYLVVILNQEIFTSDEGELYANIDSDNTASKAVLKKTMLFGDVWGEQIEKKITGKRTANSANKTANESEKQP
ncbi:MAG: DUF3108 domain-containing protein [Campylobacteraceae bacterium]|jgi:hypothetical protein|nr:DUF3108 domain-containing protein [Campylobacteraceae bacterium]